MIQAADAHNPAVNAKAHAADANKHPAVEVAEPDGYLAYVRKAEFITVQEAQWAQCPAMATADGSKNTN